MQKDYNEYVCRLYVVVKYEWNWSKNATKTPRNHLKSFSYSINSLLLKQIKELNNFTGENCHLW